MTTSLDLKKFEVLMEARVAEIAQFEEPAHDLLHFKRVVQLAKALAQIEGAKMEVVTPAAWLHDYVIVPKNDPRRKLASQLSATAAIKFLAEIEYPQIYHEDIAHAIEAHSFSANIIPKTLEAKIVQDADRLDGLGAIGIARCFATAGVLKRQFYSLADPLCESRVADDHAFTVDHFFVKLFKVAETMQTPSGQIEAARRVRVMKHYLGQLKQEIDGLTTVDSI